MASFRVLASVAGALLVSSPPSSLQVLSYSPGPDAPLTAPVQVIFDRPVAGSLDRTVDPAAIFRIAPAVSGKAEWRDPVTLRFRPAAPLAPGKTYAVTIANSFSAMDGTRLAEPFSYSFTVTGPALLTGLPVSEGDHPRFLAPDATFELVFSAPVDPSSQNGLAYLDLNAACPEPGIIRLNVTEQRPIVDQDPEQYRDAGGWQRDRSTDSLRRVLVLKPERALPLNCRGDLVAPRAIDPEGTKPFVRWGFSTYGPFRVLEARCGAGPNCPSGGIRLRFSTPVKGAEVMRRVSLLPAVPFNVSDTAEATEDWYLEAQLSPRTGYAVMVDTAMRDVFNQPLEGNPVLGFRTSGFAPMVDHEYGRLTVERAAYGTLAVKYVNVDTLAITVAPVPAALIPAVLQYSRWSRDDSLIAGLLRSAKTTRVAVSAPRDQVRIYGVKIPLYNMARPSAPLLQLVRVTSPSLPPQWQQNQPLAVVQITDLAVHARIGVSSGVVWVTGAEDGLPRGNVQVTLYDTHGKQQATGRTAPDGTVILGEYRADSTALRGYGFEGYVVASSGNDKAVTGISAYDPDLSPWQFNVSSSYGAERLPAAAAVFTDRGIYRPGEPLYAKAIVRTGTLGHLTVPARGDSIRWVFGNRDRGTALKEAVVALSSFGTNDQTVTLPSDIKLGTYDVEVQLRRAGAWQRLAGASYRVAEYRPPQFLVSASTDSAPRFPGDTVHAAVEARYLFGSPMGRAALTWSVRQVSLDFWGFEIPNTDGFFFGDNGWWWEDDEGQTPVQSLAQGTDTLDAHGRTVVPFALGPTVKGRPARATFSASVIDVNRQAVAAEASVLVHASSFYIGVKPLGRSFFWTAGEPASVGVIAVRPDGRRLSSVAVHGTIVRQEWHRVHRTREGYSEIYGEWVPDTVGHCELVTAAGSPSPCTFTPPGGGTYQLTFRSQDEAGRPASTSLYRWATGKDFVPWNDESQFKMDLVPDKTRYTVGDTATVLFAAPFTNAEAWVTVEREGLIEQRRLRLTSGATTLKFPVTEAWAPNAYVSVLVARGRSAKPGPLDDPGRPTIRVGYTELRVTPEVKRLSVTLRPARSEYRPGDSARVAVKVTDQRGAGQRSEVTLWAVDEGVLSLTGYRTPDPLDLLYAPRGLGLRLASNLTTVAPQVPEGEKGGRAPGGGGGQGESDILRSRFKATAFFLGGVQTDASGAALATAKLPDNLTTFRVMAVAVTAGDRYGSGQSPLLVTRPLLARPALPRFMRDGDRFLAGVVVNQRAGGTPTVQVSAQARGARLAGDSVRQAVLEAGRGREVRFEFERPGSGPLGDDSASFRFRVSGAGDADLVEQKLAVRPAFRPRAWTVTGVVNDSATAEVVVPDGLDPDRSTLELAVGGSPLSIARGMDYALEIYPYYCSEQVSSMAQAVIALYRAQQEAPGARLIPGDPQGEIEGAVAILSRRQRSDGAIGFWGAGDWSTPWLSAYAGLTLLDARDAGITVNDSVLARLAEYLRGALNRPTPIRAPVIGWYDEMQTRLGDQVAAADFLSRLGRPDVPAENELLRNAPQLAFEDRLRLAELLARRKAMNAARSLLEPAWAETRIEGRRATLPDGAYRYHHYFASSTRPVGRLLTATLAVDSSNALIGPLVETLTEQGRAGALEWWNTQDYAATIEALAAFQHRMRAGLARPFTVRSGGRTILASSGQRGAPDRLSLSDSMVALTGLLSGGAAGKSVVRVTLAAAGAGAPIYYALTVHEVPTSRPVNPENQGIQVERWYEKYEQPEPVTSALEGGLVRVRLRITVPEDRQFVVVDDALPAGLEAIDLSLRTASLAPGPGTGLTTPGRDQAEGEGEEGNAGNGLSHWYYGSWDDGWWSPFDHREIRDDRVIYSATVLWKGTYTMTYLARATTVGTFVRPPAHAEEMYNPAVYGRSDGGVFTVTAK
ncbi:MAG TPA: MG2 domain-containing protein [Gemmatimonadales bacterium]|nr:MG2 domain-containing protein [Gemmatimonadales bacterium]